MEVLETQRTRDTEGARRGALVSEDETRERAAQRSLRAAVVR